MTAFALIPTGRNQAVTLTKSFFVALLATAAALPAQAVSFDGALTQGATTVVDYSGRGLLSFDIDFANAAPAVLSYRVNSGDVAGGQPISLSAVLRNFSGQGFPGYLLAIDNGAFGVVGSVTRPFGGSTSVSVAGGNAATLSFSTPEFLDVEIGNALGATAGAFNWTLVGLRAGDRINVSVSVVPEPGRYALLLAGLAVVGFMARRQASRQHPRG